MENPISPTVMLRGLATLLNFQQPAPLLFPRERSVLNTCFTEREVHHPKWGNGCLGMPFPGRSDMACLPVARFTARAQKLGFCHREASGCLRAGKALPPQRWARRRVDRTRIARQVGVGLASHCSLILRKPLAFFWLGDREEAGNDLFFAVGGSGGDERAPKPLD